MSAAATQALPFNSKQTAVLDALARGLAKVRAAESAGVHRDTVHQWEKTIPGFADAVRDAQASYRERLSGQLREISQLALISLEALLASPDTSPALRFRIAQFVLTRGAVPAKQWLLPEPIEDECAPNEVLEFQEPMEAAISPTTENNVGNVGNVEKAGTVGNGPAHHEAVPGFHPPPPKKPATSVGNVGSAADSPAPNQRSPFDRFFRPG